MRLRTIEGIEAFVHAAETDRFQCHFYKIFRDRYGSIGTLTSPFERELTCNIFHVIEHAPDLERAKRRNQDTMGRIPEFLAR